MVKNKVAPPFKEVFFDIIYGEGISREGEIIDMGVAQGIIEKSGAWYSYGTERIGQGKDNVREYLRQNPAMSVEIENLVRDKLGVKSRAVLNKPTEDKKSAKASKAEVATESSFEDKANAEDE